MASLSTASSYDVFLSFRGEDTRKTFVDHLYSALVQRLIRTYKDDESLSRGESIGPSLLKAIEESQIAVIIFSKNYADSSWCLDELAYIMKCRDEREKIVMPIFYDVNPSEVRKQEGDFGKAFAEQVRENNIKAQSWRKALVDASNLAGWEPKHIANGHESVVIKNIVDTILDKLFLLSSDVDEDLVGMGTRLQDMKSRLEIGSGGVRMVGIWGVGGGGKTTLASSVFMEISHHFQGHCIVDNIREESSKYGLKILQEKILSAVLKTQVGVQSVEEGIRKMKSRLYHSKVLILLDDVDDLNQLEALAGSHKWFGEGSRIIITTRDEHLLRTHRVDEISAVTLLSIDESIRLFNRYAYQENKLIQDYESLSLRVVSYAAGLPLALKILGSFLYDKDKNEWMSALAKLKDFPNLKITDKLKISYDGLDPDEKELFLDIACFFRREEKNKTMEILDACGFNPGIGVKVLIQKALITVSGDKFDMHDLVQEMAHYIIRGDHPNNLEKHSRVWRYEEIEAMCSGDVTMVKANKKTKAIKYKGSSSRLPELVATMKKLRLIWVSNVKADKEVFETPTFLSNELRYIHLSGYLASPLPEHFRPTKLVVLNLHYSLQEELWKGHKSLPCLKELQLIDMHRLARTPDFGGLPCLQKLTLKHCSKLKRIHPSLGNHRSLVFVSIFACKKLKTLPTIIQMKKLEILEISYCDVLLEFPEIQSNMDSLVKLYLYEVAIKVLPSSVGEYCTNLISIFLGDCQNLNSIEGNFHALKHLQKFEYWSFTEIARNLPKYLFDERCCLEELHLPEMRQPLPPWRCSGYPHLPRFLRKLDLSYCNLKNGEIPSDIGELSNLQELHLRENPFSRLHFSLSQLTQLKLLNLIACKRLVELPKLPSSIVILIADECNSLKELGDFHTNCKWLCQVILTNGSIVNDGDRLLQSMLQGNAIENHSMTLQLKGLVIPKEFIPRLLRGTRCRLQLPHNWCNEYCGFLICAVLTGSCHGIGAFPPMITMKQEMGGLMEMDSQHDDVVWEESVGDIVTLVGYISFGSLRHTIWWDETYSALLFSIYILYVSGDDRDNIYGSKKLEPCTGFGVRLVSRNSESGPMESTDSFEISGNKNDYTHKFKIKHDSKSALEVDLGMLNLLGSALIQ